MEEAREEWRAGQDKGKEKAKIFLLLLKNGSFLNAMRALNVAVYKRITMLC